MPCQISSEGLTGRVPLLACPAVLFRENSPSLLDKPAVAPFSSLLATRQSKFDNALVAVTIQQPADRLLHLVLDTRGIADPHSADDTFAVQHNGGRHSFPHGRLQA